MQQAPDEKERLQMLTTVLQGATMSADVDLGALAVETAALVAQDLVSLARGARHAALQRVIKRSSVTPSTSTIRSRADHRKFSSSGRASWKALPAQDSPSRLRTSHKPSTPLDRPTRRASVHPRSLTSPGTTSEVLRLSSVRFWTRSSCRFRSRNCSPAG